VVDAPSISAFKKSLEKVRNNRMGFFVDYSSEPWALLVDDWLVRPHVVNYMVNYTSYEYSSGSRGGQT